MGRIRQDSAQFDAVDEIERLGHVVFLARPTERRQGLPTAAEAEERLIENRTLRVPDPGLSLFFRAGRTLISVDDGIVEHRPFEISTLDQPHKTISELPPWPRAVWPESERQGLQADLAPPPG